MSQIKIKDSSWYKQSFLLPDNSISDEDKTRRLQTTADYKFTDTTIGGNFTINAPYQFTRFADIKRGGTGDVPYKYSPSSGARPSPSRGMGRYYSESIDDTGVHLIMSFGLPQYNSLTNFFTSFYDSESSQIARTGRGKGTFYNIGEAASFFLTIPFQPFLIGARVINTVVDFLNNNHPTKYYYLKPAMPLYWNAVSTISNAIAVNMGLIPRIFSEQQKKLYDPVLDTSQESDKQAWQDFYDQLPGFIYRKDGGIDIYAMATRAQNLANQYNKLMINVFADSTTEDELRTRLNQFKTTALTTPKLVTLDTYIGAYLNIVDYQPENTTDGNGVDNAVNDQGQSSWTQQFIEQIQGDREDGSNFITFRVDNPGTVSESFSNSFQDTDIADNLNNMSASNRIAKINFMNGNLGDGVIATALESAVGAAKNVVEGALDGLSISGISALLGAAFVDIPQVWQNATASLPTSNFTIELRTPYGNKFSIFQDLMIPLSMILAGVLPISTGPRSYTSPMLCEWFCKGMSQGRTGMIESVNITRGTGNQGWNNEKNCLGIDISFSIKDLTTIMHMPIAANLSLWDKALLSAANAVGGESAVDTATAFTLGAYTDDSVFSDYLAVLGSLSYTDQVYTMRRWGLNRSQTKAAWEAWRTPSHFGNWFIGTWSGQMIQTFSYGTNRTD